MEYTELGQYILALCESQNLSMRQASIRAGLEPSTVSKILRRDGRVIPTPDTLGKLAEGLHGNFLHMMRLAGHLPPIVGGDGGVEDAEYYAKLQRLQQALAELSKANPTVAKRLLDLITAPVELMLREEGAAPTQEE